MEKMAQRRSRFNFQMVDIKKGSELSFYGKENIKAKVIDNNKIEYEGRVTSLSASATEILGCGHSVQGPAWWAYKGETLDDRRKRMEEE